MKQHPTIKRILDRHPEIELAILFGSMARGEERFESDLDLAVSAGRPLRAEERMALIEDLAKATGRPVDLIDLETAGVPLLGQVLRHGERLRGSDEAHARLMLRCLIDEADFMPGYRRALAERRKAWTGT